MSLTGPEAEEVLGAAQFDGAHGTVINLQYGSFCVKRHSERCIRLAVA